LSHDRKLFEKFYKDHYEEVVQRCLRARGVDDRNEAEDIAQEIFLRLWTSYDDNYFLYNEGYFWKYLVNFSIANYMAKKSKQKIFYPIFGEEYQQAISSNIELLGNYEKVLDLYRYALKRIKKRDRKVFKYAFWFGFSKAAKMLGVVHVWWWQKQRILRQFAKIVKEYQKK
jgi:DNA-directed RNA polymerase specialized sigma24 family protein